MASTLESIAQASPKVPAHTPGDLTAIPWYVWSLFAAVVSVVVGGYWDISWHMSIGRDSFWTPAHMAIQFCGILAGFTCGYLILSCTLGRDPALASASVSVWRFHGPLGAFIAAWGGATMLTSAPFDNWWHNAYGLDVKIFSPPHVVLDGGVLAIQIGALVLIASTRNRSSGVLRRKLDWLLLLLGGMITMLALTVVWESTYRVLMHTAQCYRAVAVVIPVVFAGFARISEHRWARTIVAGVYTAYAMAMLWIFPLFPATPKLGPVYQRITHLVPMEFPLLVIVPALLLDLWEPRMAGWKNWPKAAAGGLIFLGAFIAVQWPFATFLVSPGSANWFFGTKYFAYFATPNGYDIRHLFVPIDYAAFGFWMIMAEAVLLAMLSSRLGMAAGEWFGPSAVDAMKRLFAIFLAKQIPRLHPCGAQRRRALGTSAALGMTAFFLAAWALSASAHVGSPDVFVEGNAGPYKLFVTVRVPQVIPGVAVIEIRSESNEVSAIRIAPMQLTGPGSQYPPAAEAAERSKDDPQFFRGSLWLMEFGSLQVRIEAEGASGKGLLAVPIPAVAQSTLPMQRSLGLVLFALMIVLALAMVSIVAAAVREGNLTPGAPAPAARGWQVRFAAAIAGFVVAAVLSIGGLWWRSDARQYASHIYTPPEIEAAVGANGQLILRAKPIHITSGNPRRPADLIDFNDLIPDHEHLMHLFIIRSPGMDAFWHLHPQRAGSGGFTQNLPAMPAGHYQIFADVVLSTGFPVTMIGQLDLPSRIAGKPLTGDDSGIEGSAISPETGATTEYPLPEGGRMIWERSGQPVQPLEAGVALILRFRVADRSGNPAEDLEPYMGMAAHAAVMRSDGSVFAHVHPTGSVPMASFELAQASLPGNSGAGLLAAPDMKQPDMNQMDMKQMPSDKVGAEISIPYGFPKAGLYRVFVQVKRAGQIETAFFDANVK